VERRELGRVIGVLDVDRLAGEGGEAGDRGEGLGDADLADLLPRLEEEKSSWFFVSRAKIVTRSAETRSSISSLMSTRMSWMLEAALIWFAISMRRFL
jgi:hypothetical protein